jgi:hypothetical protein
MSVPSEGALPSNGEGSLRRAHVVIAVALVVAVVAAALAVVGLRKLSDDSHPSSTGATSTGSDPASLAANSTTALVEGGQIAVDFTSFNYQTLDQDFAATAAHATPAFAKTYLSESRTVASLIKKAKAVSVAQVVATGLQAYEPAKGTATVIVALNDTTKNTKSPAGTVQYFRMQVQLVNQDGKWLATAVSPQ